MSEYGRVMQSHAGDGPAPRRRWATPKVILPTLVARTAKSSNSLNIEGHNPNPGGTSSISPTIHS